MVMIVVSEEVEVAWKTRELGIDVHYGHVEALSRSAWLVFSMACRAAIH
jgi:hypothetical protein